MQKVNIYSYFVESNHRAVLKGREKWLILWQKDRGNEMELEVPEVDRDCSCASGDQSSFPLPL